MVIGSQSLSRAREMGSYCTSELQEGFPKEMVCKLSSCRVSIKATLVTFIGMISAETQDKIQM